MKIMYIRSDIHTMMPDSNHSTNMERKFPLRFAKDSAP